MVRIEGSDLDIFFCAETQTEIVESFVALFSRNKRLLQVGLVEISLSEKDGSIKLRENPLVAPKAFEYVMATYMNRHIVNKISKKALIPVHGIRSYGEWNAEVAHIASSNGWIIAPFTYGYVEWNVLFKAAERRKIIDKFRDHIVDIQDRYNCHISLLAHSFGTYIVGSYLLGFGEGKPPVVVDTVILTGSILNENIDFKRFKGKAYKIINEIAPNDGVVAYARPANLWQDPLLGRSGDKGFMKSSDMLEQHTGNIFDHNNVIRRDVIARRWVPWLEANVGQMLRAEALEEQWQRSRPRQRALAIPTGRRAHSDRGGAPGGVRMVGLANPPSQGARASARLSQTRPGNRTVLAATPREHDPEKWIPVFRQDHAHGTVRGA